MMAAMQTNSLRGTLRLNEPMSRHTSWRVGGPAQRFYAPADLDDLAEFLRQLDPAEPLMWLGLGSNVLVRDGGIKGTVIATLGALSKIERRTDGTIRAEAGVTCAKVAKFCAQQQSTGAEFFAGIPGTMGGALAMNAGAFGGETWPLVARVETIDRHGVVRTRGPEDFRVAYRHVQGVTGEWFVAAHLRLASDESGASRQRIKELLDKRNRSQPVNMPSCGSVFRNPTGDHAGRLIEASGLKGVCIGGACVSDKHANFIVNTGAATARDVEALIKQIQRVVHDKHGVMLIPEVHIIGEDAP